MKGTDHRILLVSSHIRFSEKKSKSETQIDETDVTSDLKNKRASLDRNLLRLLKDQKQLPKKKTLSTTNLEKHEKQVEKQKKVLGSRMLLSLRTKIENFKLKIWTSLNK
jgi:hypothetical protein